LYPLFQIRKLPGQKLLVVVVAAGSVGLELKKSRRLPLVDRSTGAGDLEEQQWTGTVQERDVHVAITAKRINQFADEVEFDFRVFPIAVPHPHSDVNVGAWHGAPGGLGTEEDDHIQAITMGYMFQFLAVYLVYQDFSMRGDLGRPPRVPEVL